jgi:hypothetical protein
VSSILINLLDNLGDRTTLLNLMSTSKDIATRLDRVPDGTVFTYTDFLEEVQQKEALIKALNRMAAAGKIAKLSKGKFYKPEQSPFGELPPPQYQAVKDLLKTRGKVTGYLSGLSIYPQLGLTTQVSNTIQIGKNETRPAFQRGRYNISFIKQKNTITKENIPGLQLLDAMRCVKKIPDTTVSMACERFKDLISQNSRKEQERLVNLAMKYPPSTRALLGAVLDAVAPELNTEKLKQSLNPITRYTLPGITEALLHSQDWNIE